MPATSTTRPTSSEKKRAIPVVGIIFAVVAVLAVIAVVFAGTSEPGSEYGDPTVSGQLTAAPPNVAVDTEALGEALPAVAGEDFAGDAVKIEDDGNAKAIVFLAHWCPHCQNEVPEVQAWLNGGGSVGGVDLYSVSTSMSSGRDNYPASAWLEREGWTVPLIVDDQDNSVYRAFGSGGFPFWVFVNSDGTVALRRQGFTPVDELVTIMESLS
jgi:thiol-disulfide isomerase/thioredoxin